MTRYEGRKSEAVGLVLTVLFGPMGLLYSSPAGGIALFFVAILLAFVSGGYGALLTWPIAVVVGLITVRGHNRRLMQSTPRGPGEQPLGGAHRRPRFSGEARSMQGPPQNESAVAAWENEGGPISTPPREPTASGVAPSMADETAESTTSRGGVPRSPLGRPS